jgi:hypothetical protein
LRASGVVCATVVAGVIVTGCANQRGLDLARQACRHVDRSLALYVASSTAASSELGGARRSEALAQLRQALPLAATAAGEASQWQGLMATLAESSHVPESDLISALREQCATAESNGVPGQLPSTSVPGTGSTPSTG